MPLENVVRPFETPNYAPGAPEIAPGYSDSAAPVRIRPGLTGRGKQFQVHYSASTTVYAIKRPAETQA